MEPRHRVIDAEGFSLLTPQDGLPIRKRSRVGGGLAHFSALTVCRQDQTLSENMGRSPSLHRPVNASSNPSVTGRTGSPSYENGTHCSCAANKGRPIIDSRRVLPGAGGERNRQYDSNSNSINSCSNSSRVGLLE